MAAMYIPFWPFPEDEAVTIHWISSPAVDYEGRKTCEVYFRRSLGSITSVTMAWGYLPELWIGRQFKNRIPIDDAPTTKSSPMIDTKYIKHVQYARAIDTIPYKLYCLAEKRIFDEWCCSFEYDGYIYIIPCVELARVLYARNSVLANQLLSTGGLENLIDLSSWRVEEDMLLFDFAAEVPGISRNFANNFVTIFGNPVLKNGWDYTYTQYAATGKIKTQLPQLAGLKLRCTGVGPNRSRFVMAAEMVSIPCPYNHILYGPEKLIHTGKGSAPNGVMKSTSSAETVDMDLSGTAAKRAGATILERTSELSLFEGVNASRKTRKKDMAPRVKVIQVEKPDEVYSPGDIIGGGKLPFVNIECRYIEKVQADADFEQFCEALNWLIRLRDIRLLSLSYNQLPVGKRVCVLDLPGHRPRRYAYAVIEKEKMVWFVLEVCNKDGHSVSTLFIRSNGEEKELVDQTIDKFMRNNGSWRQADFADLGRYRTLDHHKGRSAKRWAELMYEKMG